MKNLRPPQLQLLTLLKHVLNYPRNGLKVNSNNHLLNEVLERHYSDSLILHSPTGGLGVQDKRKSTVIQLAFRSFSLHVGQICSRLDLILCQHIATDFPVLCLTKHYANRHSRFQHRCFNSIVLAKILNESTSSLNCTAGTTFKGCFHYPLTKVQASFIRTLCLCHNC